MAGLSGIRSGVKVKNLSLAGVAVPILSHRTRKDGAPGVVVVPPGAALARFYLVAQDVLAGEALVNKMHIDYANLTIVTEGDVEQKVLMPLLQGETYLGIPERRIFTKQYLAPTTLDKDAGKSRGYLPDYGIWFRGLLVMVVEAKAPDISVETGYREASLYARHVNQKYPTDVNPCHFILACNGKDLLFGHWDSMPVLQISMNDLIVGSAELERLQLACGAAVLEARSIESLRRLRQPKPTAPYNLMGGPPS